MPHPPASPTPRSPFCSWATALLVLAAIYAFQAVRSRGKPPVERRGTLNLGDQLFSDWAAGPHAIDPTPGTFSLYGRKDPNALEDPEPDPRRR